MFLLLQRGIFRGPCYFRGSRCFEKGVFVALQPFPARTLGSDPSNIWLIYIYITFEGLFLFPQILDQIRFAKNTYFSLGN